VGLATTQHYEKGKSVKIRDLLESKILVEGVHDPAIFKAVFVIGGPGSGKSKVSELLALKSLGFVTVNSDEAFSHLLTKHGLSLKMPPEEETQRSVMRSRAKEITANKMQLALDGRLGVVIDGTGEDYRKIAAIHTNLKEMGYESFLIIVYASLETALRRNAKRERSVPETIVEKKWRGVQENLDEFLLTFEHSTIIDNNGNLNELIPQTEHVYKMVAQWSKSEPSSDEAQTWINDQLGITDEPDEYDDVEDDDIEDDDIEDDEHEDDTDSAEDNDTNTKLK